MATLAGGLDEQPQPHHRDHGGSGAAVRSKFDKLLDAIRQVETGGHPDPARAVGDGGAARGPYQIHLGYWRDAGGPADWLRLSGDERTCRAVIGAYWSRFAPHALRIVLTAGDGEWTAYELGAAERLARVHNGGPGGCTIAATVVYWHKVRAALLGK